MAKILVNHMVDDNGNMLAHVEENPGFQDVYDYKGSHARLHRLERRREEVAWNFNAQTHLFQKTYYATGLTRQDEETLRSQFKSLNQ